MNGTYSPTALSRWSCQQNQLPPVEDVKNIHVYDFDNTVFHSPLPNKQIWNSSTCGSLQAQEFLYQGGWWHNPKILEATGDGVEIEEPRAWSDHWNEDIIELIRLSMADNSTLNVLLTGRGESKFSDLISRMLASKGLSFHIVALKPSTGPRGQTFKSTMLFKQALLQDIVFTYPFATELKIYEDRPKHVKGFREYFTDLNSSLLATSSPPRPPITADVIQVSDEERTLNPTTEIALIQSMINAHNSAVLAGTAPKPCRPYKIKRSVFYTGYLISNPDVDRLKNLIKLPANMPDHEIKYLANNILISPRPVGRSILDKVGGIGAKMRWRVTGISHLDHRIWAAKVEPVTPGAKFHTDNPIPCVVLAVRRQTKPIEASRMRNFQPVPEQLAYQFETTVGEKVLLRIEEERKGEDEYEASFPNANGKNARKHPREEEWPALGSQPRPQQRGIGFASQRGGGARGGQMARPQRGRFQGRGRGGGGGGGGMRGRGRGGYKSLDDSVGQGYGGASMQY